jgi:serine protease Do
MIAKPLMPSISTSTARSRPPVSRLFVAALCLALLSPLPAAWAQAAPLVRGLPDFTELVDAVGPSVVNIRTLEKAQSKAGGSNAPDEQMLEFFRRFGIPVPPGVGPRSPRQAPPDEEAQPSGVGSGFVLTADGFIMTNAHVIDGADELLVTLPDKREFKARVIGSDKRTDVAVVKVDAVGLSPVKIGDVSRLRVGEWVMAIGSPFGLDNTVTAGIVSAKQRDTGDYLPFIQTDVAINPGNSGGPLINMRGEVVGINSQIYSRSGGFQGISFAIPIDEAVRVSEQLRTIGRVSRGRIGVQIDQVSKEVAESIGLGQARGAFVRGVEPNSPAAKAGLEPGDIIVRFDGKAIERSADLPRLVGNTAPGTASRITIFRRGAQRELSITVAEVEGETARAAATPSAPEPAPKSVVVKGLGLGLSDLTEAQKKAFDVPGGVVVVSAEGPAARAGLREDDVIVSVANEQINHLKSLEAVLAKQDRNTPLSVLFRRGKLAQITVIRPEPR